MLTVAWFSAGVSSAVATRLVVESVDEIIYTHIDDQHPDTMRFVRDCEAWFGKPITILQSDLKSVDAACRMSAFINGPYGAACTRLLKKRVRKEWESRQTEPLLYVWGMDVNERARCSRLNRTMPDQKHSFPLVENKMTKADAHRMLAASGIKRPAMYDLGYNNNNCVGCVKGGMGYWNHIRRDFPEVFNARAKTERVVGHSCINGVFLDELEPGRGLESPPIVADCGILCEALRLEGI